MRIHPAVARRVGRQRCRCSGCTSPPIRPRATRRARPASSAGTCRRSARGHRHRHAVGARRLERDLRHDEQHRQVGLVPREQRGRFRRRAARVTSAPSDVPIILSCRAASSARLTSSRTAQQTLPPAGERASISASTLLAGSSARCTDASRAARRAGGRQSSSAVTGRIGASRRASPSAMMYIAVCAERRSRRRRRERVQADPSTRPRRTRSGRPSGTG